LKTHKPGARPIVGGVEEGEEFEDILATEIDSEEVFFNICSNKI
jgi:hypothetical protein